MRGNNSVTLSHLLDSHYEHIFRSLPQGVVFQDANGRIVAANPAAERILGRTFDEMRGLTSASSDWEPIHEDGAPFPASEHPSMVSLRTGKPVGPVRLGVRLPRADKEHRWLLVEAVPLFDDETELGSRLVFTSFLDVTKQVHAEQALQLSMQRYQSIVDSSPMGLHAYRLEADGRLVFTGANAAADRLTGVDSRQFIGKTIEEAFPSSVDMEFPAAYRNVVRTGEPWRTDQVFYEDEQIAGAFEVHAFCTGPDSMAVLFLEVTERVRSAQALSASEARYRALVDASPDAICVVSADGRIQQGNRSLATLHGYDDPAEIIGRFGYELMAPAEQQRARELFEPKGGFGPSEFRMLRRDGSEFDAEVVGALLPEQPEEVPKHVFVSRDVTTQKRASSLVRLQRDLAQRLASAASVFEALSMCVRTSIDATAADGGSAYLVDPDSGELELLLAHGPPVPLTAEDPHVGTFAADSVPARIVRSGQAVFGGVEEATQLIGSDFHQRTGLRAFGALPVAYEDTVAVLVLHSRSVDAFSKADQEVLESVAAQLQGCLGRLHMATEQLDLVALVENSTDMVAIVSPEGRVRYANAAARDLLGIDEFDELEAACGEMLVGGDVEAYKQVIAAVQRSGSCTGERQLSHVLAATFNAYQLPGRDDIAFTVTDITAIRQAEAALIEAERRAAEERTELQQQLAQSQKMEAVGQLAGGIAHDFNNLLTGIIGCAEMLLLQLEDNTEAHTDAQTIHAAAERASALTSQLLAFSRRQIVAPKVLDLNQVISQSQRMLARIIGENIELRFIEAEDCWSVRVDPSQVDQILINLVTNARDALPDGGRLTIETKNVAIDEAQAERHVGVAEGDYALLSVADNGSGMDAETVQRVFEPFFSTKEVGRGTGLGLSTVYGIVRQSKGFIDIDSDLGAGTTVKVYFPRTFATSADEAKPQAAPARGHETVLVVEDESIVRELAQRILQGQGYHVLVAKSGSDACSLNNETIGSVSLLLTDVIMPKMNGRELYQQLAKRHGGLRVLYMSGHAENVIAHHGVLEEGTAFIQKPFSAEALTRKVREVLDES